MRAPRIFCIPATEAPVLAVLRRGPTGWFHVGRWDVDAWTYEPGAWFRGRLFPQKCDLSPDGRWLAYSAHKPMSDWAAGPIYEAVSRLPWLHALAAWGAGSTYTRGIRFDAESRSSGIGPPDIGDAAPILARYGLRANRAHQFAVERRRGWSEWPDTPPRDTRDVWDERRSARMIKRQPGGNAVLEVEGDYAAFRDMPSRRTAPCYTITDGDSIELLDDTQWADWSASGALLRATVDGRLRAHEWRAGPGALLFEHDLSAMMPRPEPAPAWAHEW